MTDFGKPIARLETEISRRLRMLAVQDLIALSGLVAAGVGLITFMLLRPGVLESRIAEGIGIRGRLVLCAIPVVAAGALFALRRLLGSRGRWKSNLETGPDHADVIIDRALDLEDRAQAAGSIIRRGGPATVMEAALVEDTASRLSDAAPQRIVEYHLPRPSSAARCYTSLGAAIVLALIVLVAIVQYRLSAHRIQELDGGTAAVMQAVGDDLERSTETIERSVKPDTPTAGLARQQAELARALKAGASPERRGRMGPIEKSQALKELSAIEEKLGSRKNELENTRASEIINLAERRFKSTLSGTTSVQHKGVAELPHTPNKKLADKNSPAHKPPSADDQGADDKSGAEKSGTQDKGAKADDLRAADSNGIAEKQGLNRKQPSADKPSELAKAAGEPSQARDDGSIESQTTGKTNPDQAGRVDSRPGEQRSDGPEAAAKDESQSVSPEKEAAARDTVTGMLPNLSEDLMKKAAEMRADKLTPADIEQFRKAAEGLLKDLSAKDLVNLANSKEIQQTLEQLARQVNPQQVEQLARQLLSQKEIRDELQAAGKLLMENRQAKETIAGFADKAREIAKQFQQQGYKPGRPPEALPGPPEGFAEAPSGLGQPSSGASSGSGSGSGGSRRSYGRLGPGAEALNGSGRSSDSARRGAKGENLIDSKPEGEPVYGRARPGAAPARVPYSTAYPGYRREAERSVERSQVPPRLRALIRNYFDAINPEADKRP